MCLSDFILSLFEGKVGHTWWYSEARYGLEVFGAICSIGHLNWGQWDVRQAPETLYDQSSSFILFYEMHKSL